MYVLGYDIFLIYFKIRCNEIAILYDKKHHIHEINTDGQLVKPEITHQNKI